MKHLITFSVITLMAIPAHAQERFVTFMEAQQASVVMESSDDLLQWVTTTNGLKSGEVDHFFRVRLQKPTP